MPKENIRNYSEFKDELVQKNKTATFRKAVSEIDDEMRMKESRNQLSETNENRIQLLRNVSNDIVHEVQIQTPEKITLKDMPITAIIATFEEGYPLLESLYSSLANSMADRFLQGNGLDYLTILYRTVSSNQQHQMYGRMLEKFTKNQREYIENPTVRNFSFRKNLGRT